MAVSPSDCEYVSPDVIQAPQHYCGKRNEKDMISISKQITNRLKSKVKGQIVLPTDSSYDEVRQIWNAMIDRRPTLIVRCAEADDVPPAIAFARQNGLEISIRGADITEPSDGALNSIIEFAGKLPSPNCEILIALIAGAANRVPMDAMARPREAKRENTRCGL